MDCEQVSPLALAAAVALCLVLGACGEKGVGTEANSAPEQEQARPLGPPTVTLESPQSDRSLSSIFERIDPANDTDWDTEVLSARALDALEELFAPLGTSEPPPASPSNLKVHPLRPSQLTESKRSLLKIRRLEKSSEERVPFAKSLASLRLPFLVGAKIETKLKITGITVGGDETFTTEVIYLASGSGSHGTVQQNARWKLQWTTDDPPQLLAVSVTHYEEIVPLSTSSLRFEDLTASAFANAPSVRAQLMRGIDHWRPRLQGDFGVDVNGLQGLAIADADGDGLDDLFVCQQGGLPNKLYLRQPDGTLRDHSAAAKLDWMEVTRAALFVDLDNDGDQDLAMAQGWYWVLMENDGKGVFTKRAETRAPSNLHSLAAADVDLDGDLDLFFCGRNPAREFDKEEGILGQPMPYHDANNGGANVFLRNEGEWQFLDATVQSGLDHNNRRYSYACSWEDYDLDGDPDLYVANDFGRNNLYRNDGGRFTDVAAELGVEDMSAGMGVTWGDYNNDGRPDLYVSNMFSSAGNRITYQRQFREGAQNSREHFQRHARGNTLFANNGPHFDDVSVPAAVSMARWAWGAKFADLNNDGWEDLYVANGFITSEDTGDL